MKKQFENLRLSLYPKCVVVITSINNQNQVGATTVAWDGVASSRPPTVSISLLPDSFTRSCILETREFVVNIPDGRFWREANYLGSVSGPWSKKAKNKACSRLSLSASAEIRSPRIEQFYLNFECRALSVHQIGLYDLILGQVLAMHCDESAYLTNHKKGNVDHKKFQPILCLGDEYWSAGQYLGKSTENKQHPHGAEH